MKVKINEQLICIPPHLSATWAEVASLQSEEESEPQKMTLIIHMKDGKLVRIPCLDAAIVEIAFSCHMQYLEQEKEEAPVENQKEPHTFGALLQQLTGMSPEQLSEMPIQFGISGLGGTGMDMAFQHNLEQADSPDMPPEVIEKISEMAKIMTQGDPDAFPKPEPHCNCMHCQVARAIHGIEKEEIPEELEEPVSEEDLKFRTWDIEQTGDKLFKVINPLNADEHYHVHLGDPVGCTCGEAHCEHIKAVLYS